MVRILLQEHDIRLHNPSFISFPSAHVVGGNFGISGGERFAGSRGHGGGRFGTRPPYILPIDVPWEITAYGAHTVRKKVPIKVLSVSYVPSQVPVAAFFTKPVSNTLFLHHRGRLYLGGDPLSAGECYKKIFSKISRLAYIN